MASTYYGVKDGLYYDKIDTFMPYMLVKDGKYIWVRNSDALRVSSGRWQILYKVPEWLRLLTALEGRVHGFK